MIVLFVHGMGRTPLSGRPILRVLRQAGFNTATFAYSTTFESCASIRERLIAKIDGIAARGKYIVIGHSLGGVLLRSAISTLPDTSQPPQHIFLLGSPIHPSSLAIKLQSNFLFQMLTGDCGRMLASATRMPEAGAIDAQVTCIVGTQDFAITRKFFGNEPNDGIVTVAEASANWIPDQIQLPVIHTLLPSNPSVAKIILDKITQSSKVIPD
jgi:triacylglycerol esterase/lipase EstA (alpha/beta hydrolase family)